MPKVDVPPGPPATDLASVPPLLLGYVTSYAQHTLAALAHDVLCESAQAGTDPEQRRQADQLFRVALDEVGTPWAKRWV